MTWWYLAGLAYRDLTARTALRATLIVGLAVGAAVAFGLIGFGFVYGVERAEYARVGRDPLARCLWAGDNQYGGRISTADVTQVAEAARTAAPDRLRGVYPIRLVSYQIRMANGSDTSITGRTMSLGDDPDPLPASRALRPGGRWFRSPEDRGAVVTPRLLALLGFDPEHPPESLELVYTRFTDPVPVPILGVMVEDLPARNHGFVIPEPLAQELAYPSDPNPAGAAAQSGEVPAAWITQPDADYKEMLDPKIRAIFEKIFHKDDGFRYNLRRFARGYQIVANRLDLDSPIRQKEWLKRFNQAAKEIGGDVGQFVDIKVDAVAGPAADPDREVSATRYSQLAIYTDDVRVLGRVADVVERHALPNGRSLVVDRGVIEQVTRIGEQAGRYESGMLVVAVTMSAVFAGMVWFVFRVRAEQQVAEIGMLKAMGMSRLGWLSAFQGLFVGAAGVAVGIAIGWVGIGVLAARFYPLDPQATTAAAYREWWLFAMVAGIAIAACVGCAWEATRRARALSPAEAIRTSG